MKDKFYRRMRMIDTLIVLTFVLEIVVLVMVVHSTVPQLLVFGF